MPETAFMFTTYGVGPESAGIAFDGAASPIVHFFGTPFGKENTHRRWSDASARSFRTACRATAIAAGCQRLRGRTSKIVCLSG